MKKQSYSVVKRSKTTKKNSWVHKDLKKALKRSVLKRMELCSMLKMNRTTKSWMEEHIPYQQQQQQQQQQQKLQR